MMLSDGYAAAVAGPGRWGSTTAVPTPPPMHTRAARVDQFGRVAERAGDVADGLADGERDEVGVLLPTAWMTSVMVPALGVGVGDGQRDALGALGRAHDDELARAAGSARCAAPRRPAG